MLYYFTELSPLLRAAIAFFISFGLSLLIGNKLIFKLTSLKVGQPVRSKEEIDKLHDLHGKKAGTPTMGGVMILFTLVLATFLAADLGNPFVQICLFVLLALGFLGAKDDWVKVSQNHSDGVSSKYKLVWQFSVAAFAALWMFFHPQINGKIVESKKASGKYAELKQLTNPAKKTQETSRLGYYLALAENNEKNDNKDNKPKETPLLIDQKKPLKVGQLYIPGLNTHINLGFLTLILFIFVIVGASNAVNLTDGLDGLASGVTLSSCAAYVVIIALAGVSSFQLPTHAGLAELNVFVLAMMGAVTGFLWFNSYPARIFMGDTGSLALGGALAMVAICAKQELLLLLIGLVFVLEALSVMLQVSFFKLTKNEEGKGKRLFRCAPLHHHFELGGWKENQVIVRFWIISVISAGAGLVILFIG